MTASWNFRLYKSLLLPQPLEERTLIEQPWPMESSLGEHSETLKLKTPSVLQGQLQERMRSVQHRLFWERENSLVQSVTASKSLPLQIHSSRVFWKPFKCVLHQACSFELSWWSGKTMAIEFRLQISMPAWPARYLTSLNFLIYTHTQKLVIIIGWLTL